MELLDEVARDGRAVGGDAADGTRDSCQQIAGQAALGDVAKRPGPQGGKKGLAVIMHGVDEGDHGRIPVRDRSNQLDAGIPRQIQIRQQHVDLCPVRLPQGILRTGEGHHREVRLCGKDADERVEEAAIIFYQCQADHASEGGPSEAW